MGYCGYNFKVKVRSIIDKLISALSSARFAILLTGGILLFLFLGMVIPQKGFMSYKEFEAWRKASPSLISILESSGLLNIYSHPVLFTLFILLLINVLLCTAKRWKGIREALILNPPSKSGYACIREIPLDNTDKIQPPLEPLFQELRKRGYGLHLWTDSFRAIKNARSIYGSLIFHISFLFIMLGAIGSMWTRFTGTLILAEGQHFTGRMEQFHSASRHITPLEASSLRFALQKISPSFNENGRLTGLVARIRIPEGDGSVAYRDVKMNRPLRLGPFEIHLKGFGYTPLWILRDGSGRELDGAFVNLVVGGERVDSFNIPYGGYRVFVRFYPDLVSDKNLYKTASWEPKNPHFFITVKKGEDVRFEGMVPIGKVALFDNLSLEFREVRYWGRFSIVKDRGKGVMFFSFILAITGLVWKLILYRREVSGILMEREGRRILLILCSSDYYMDLFRGETEEILKRSGVV